jgi:uncharacterized protein (TIGR00251 family)
VSVVEELFEMTGDDALVLRLHVQPGAGRTAVVGRHGDALKVRVAAPPEGERANAACIDLVASIFGVKAAAIELTAGADNRTKRISVAGVERQDAVHHLEAAIEAGNARPGPGVHGPGR